MDALVLIAADEQPVAGAMAEILRTRRLRVIIADDNQHALTLARREQPDLILVDTGNKATDGVQLCDWLKTGSTTASIPLIIVSPKGADADRAAGLAAGADEFVTRPFSPSKLLDVVARFLTGRGPASGGRRLEVDRLPDDRFAVDARQLSELLQRERVERQALEEARSRQRQLGELKAAFVGTVTHELLTPFARIGLALQVLQQRTQEWPPEIRDAVEELTTEIAGLHRLVSGVVKFTQLVGKSREPRPGLIALSQVVPPAVQPVAILAQGRGIDFRVFVPADLPSLYADPELVAEAVFQMAHNAVKFNHAGGRAEVRAFQASAQVVIEVKDTGIGLTEERKALLSCPFEQSADGLRRGQEGLGVGWQVVRYVAEVHGGSTEIHSDGSGMGSTFRLALPLQTGAPT